MQAIQIFWISTLAFSGFGEADLLRNTCRQRRKVFVVGGQDSQLGNYEFMVTIMYESNGKRMHHCGGTMISSSHVLTAAHCIFGIRDGKSEREDVSKDLKVVLGIQNLQDIDAMGHIFTISSYTVHPRFDQKNKKLDGAGDILVAKLHDPENKIPGLIQQCAVDIVKLPENQQQVADLLEKGIIALGWGKTEKVDISDHLQEVQLTYISRDACLKSRPDLKEGSVCAVANEGKDTCKSDSGGPTLVKITQGKDVSFVQVGIVQVGGGKCGKTKPAVYGDTVHYGNWIKEAVQQLGCWTPYDEEMKSRMC